MARQLLVIENAQLIHKNFEGKETDFNRLGNRNFGVVIEDGNTAKEMAADGWNIKAKVKREVGNFGSVHILSWGDGEVELSARNRDTGIMEPSLVFPFEDVYFWLTVDANFGKYPPEFYLVSGRNRIPMGPDEVYKFDSARIVNADVEISPSRWEVNGKSGIKAYLSRIFIEIAPNRLDEKYGYSDDAMDDED